MKTLAFPLIIEAHREDGGFLAYFPSLLGCRAWGETWEAAARNAEEALSVHIETLAANGDVVPESRDIDDYRSRLRQIAARRSFNGLSSDALMKLTRGDD